MIWLIRKNWWETIFKNIEIKIQEIEIMLLVITIVY